MINLQDYLNVYKEDDIAIIGMSCRFPYGSNTDEFWSNLISEKDCIREFPVARKEELKEIVDFIYDIDFAKAGYIDNIVQFEPEIFSISHSESCFIDPQHRLLLELVEEAILDSGYNPKSLYDKPVGVFIAENSINYTERICKSTPMSLVNSVLSANAGRIAYTYNFRGPAVSIGTACSSSLVALHYACESLKTGEIDIAVSGGAEINLLPKGKQRIGDQPIMSIEQKVRAFDKDANGTVAGEGGGILVLKLLKKAVEDRDNIYAVIKGSAVNSNGNWSNGLASPSQKGQADVILKAVENSQIGTSEIAYIEAHGTGTKVGDPIEIAGINDALARLGYKKKSVPIGSLKTNIGHLNGASGIAGVIKTVLSLKNRKIPASLNFKNPNPLIDFENSPVYVNTKLNDWNTKAKRIAGVTSLGLIGTNCHMIFEEALEVKHSIEENPSQNIIVMSARTKKSLVENIKLLNEYLCRNMELSIDDVSFTLNCGRRDLRYKHIVIADSTNELQQKLGEFLNNKENIPFIEGGSLDISPVFIFPDMIRVDFEGSTRLFKKVPAYRAIYSELTANLGDFDLHNSKVQYLLIMYSYVKLLELYSIKPKAVLGIGTGNLIADLVTGKSNLRDTLNLLLNYNEDKKEIKFDEVKNLLKKMSQAGINILALFYPENDLSETFEKVLHSESSIEFIVINNGSEVFHNTISAIIRKGLIINWEEVYRYERRKRVSLPGYIFDRRHYFIEVDDFNSNALNMVYPNFIKKEINNTVMEKDNVFETYNIKSNLYSFFAEVYIEEEFLLDESVNNLELDSISIMQFTAKVKKAYNVDVPMKIFFDDISIKEVLTKVEALISSNVAKGAGIAVQPKKEFYPLSYAQKRIFVLEQLTKGSIAYNIPSAVVLEGELDIKRLENVFKNIIDRHESLRTSFEMLDLAPVQRIHKNVDFNIEIIEATDKSQEELLRSFIRPFEFSIPPLMRVGIAAICENKHLLLFDMHHIISDGASIKVLINDLKALFIENELPDLEIQYKDFSVWQDELYNSDVMKSKEKYWLNVFKGVPPALNIPTDFKRPPIQSFEGDSVSFCINRTLTGKLHRFCRDRDVTLYMLMLTAYNILLSKYSGQQDIIVGTPVSGRIHGDLEGLIGMFVNTLAMRNSLVINKTFKEFLTEVKVNTLNAFENQEYPFEELIEKLNLTRDMSRNPLFDTMFALQNAAVNESEIEIGSLKIKPCNCSSVISKFDFSVNAFERDGEIMFEIEYCKKLFRKGTIEGMGNSFIKLLEEVMRNPEIEISQICMIYERERYELLYSLNQTYREYPKDMTIHKLFEEKAKKYSDNVALIYGEDRITYRELNEKSNQLAHRIIESGVESDGIIGLLAERSISMVIGIMAILKAGCAYLPVSPDLPENRIKYMFDDSKVNIVIAQNNRVYEYMPDIKIFNLDDQSLYGGNLENPAGRCKSSNLAYVIYTSGSTGKPKGVMVEHLSVINLLTALQDSYTLRSGDSYLLKTSYTFDVSVTELFGWFFEGGKLVISKKGIEKDPRGILDLINKHDITHINFVPSMLKSFISVLRKEDIPVINKLKYMFVAGEAIPYELVAEVRSIIKDVEFVNLYGPTEATVYASACSLRNAKEAVNMPIGKPLQNVRIYILGREKELLPFGIPGELCIAGDGLARGYLNRLELTNEKFVSNPFEEGEKLYCTGDLARWLPDGNIEYMGRIDRQIKIRGFRIEPGEIQSVLLKYDAVKDAIVIEKADGDGTKYLCAYIKCDVEPDINALISFLAKDLPEYMIPSFFVRLESFPLTYSGKIDINLLPDPRENIIRTTEYTAPRNAIEEKLVKVWSDVLQIKKIGINDNFFTLGGNSLKAVKVILELTNEYDVRINDIFENQTIASLAQKLSVGRSNLKLKLNELKAIKFTNIDLKEKDMYDNEVKEKYMEYENRFKEYDIISLKDKKIYNKVFIAGATGYLGIYILRELLENTCSKVYLLVRGKNTKESEERLVGKYRFFFKESLLDKYKPRFEVINGDMTKEFLGISEDNYFRLAQEIDCVFNCAANVKHYGQLNEFTEINVNGTQRLLNFAACLKIKDYNHVSTSSVGAGSIEGKKYTLFTEYEYDLGQIIDSYYINSKKQAEKIVLEARAKGLNCNIYRVGNMVFDSKTGRFQQNIEENAFYNLIRAFIQLGIIPKFKREAFDFSFVDLVAKAIMRLYDVKVLQNETHHVINPNRISFFELGGLINSYDYLLKEYGFDELLDYVYDNYDVSEKREYIDSIFVHSHILENINKTNSFIAYKKTVFILDKLGFSWTQINEGHIKSMLEHCIERNFIIKNKSKKYGGN